MIELPQTIAWHYFACKVPANWEVIRFGTSDRKGTLNFSTRKGAVASISWEQMRKRPVAVNVMNDFMARHLLAIKEVGKIEQVKLRLETLGEWTLGSWMDDYPLQATRYLEDQGVFLQWAFPHSTHAELQQLHEPLLKSLQLNNEDWREWCLWKFPIVLPAGFRPVEVNALPASESMKFSNPQKAQVVINRWGLTGEILKKQSLKEFSIKQFDKLMIRIVDLEETSLNGHDAIRFKLKKRGEMHLDKLYGRYWDGDAIIWHNPEVKRIYCIRQIVPNKIQPLNLEGLTR